jgi:2-oxoglutarate ferredoxin oxidoreductase subunit alpha
MPAIREARRKGIKVGHLRLVVVWPFPEAYIRQLAQRVGALIVPELNLGQVVLEVERCAAGACKIVPVLHAGGAIHDPRTICEAIMETAS